MGLLVSTAAMSLALLAAPVSVGATGLESVDLPPLNLPVPEGFRDGAAREAAKLQAAEENFQQSDTLKRLLEQSEANKAKNKKAVADKYCYRQAELGIGDCGGLRYIPGLTENGKQRTPDWLADLLGVERQPPAAEQKTLKDLFGGQVPQ